MDASAASEVLLLVQEGKSKYSAYSREKRGGAEKADGRRGNGDPTHPAA